MLKKERVLTGIKPTGEPHLGNYLGAIKPAIMMSQKEEYECFYFMANYHSLTTIHSAKELKELTYKVTASWLALGLDPNRAVLFAQSDVPEIFELSWILSCCTSKGLMNRAHAYKALVDRNVTQGDDPDAGINMGIYCYPILMSADILTFQTDWVPVGEDQLQHIEIARDIASCFNHRYKKNLLKLPKATITENVGEIPGLDGRKMSKSYGNTIPLFMPPNSLRKLVMRIVTDSTPPEAPKDPDTSLIFKFYSLLATPEELQTMRESFLRGISWGEAKQQLYELFDRNFSPFRELYNRLLSDKGELDRILLKGAERARQDAVIQLENIRKSIGI